MHVPNVSDVLLKKIIEIYQKFYRKNILSQSIYQGYRLTYCDSENTIHFSFFKLSPPNQKIMIQRYDK